MALLAGQKQQLLSAQLHLYPNVQYLLWNQQLTPKAFLAALPHRHLSDQKHGSAKLLTTLLVIFILVQQRLLHQPLLNVTFVIVQNNNAKLNQLRTQNYFFTQVNSIPPPTPRRPRTVFPLYKVSFFSARYFNTLYRFNRILGFSCSLHLSFSVACLLVSL